MVVRYKTFPSFFNEIDELFASTKPVAQRPSFIPPVRGLYVKDSSDSINVVVDLPGIAKEDVKVALHDGVLNITAERKKPELKEHEQWIRNEIRYGTYERSVNLPYPVIAEKITATHENGLLTIILPKAEEAKPKEILIK